MREQKRFEDIRLPENEKKRLSRLDTREAVEALKDKILNFPRRKK